MALPLGQALFLILSNVAFLLPSGLAYYHKMFYEGTIYLLMCVVSALYHVVDTGLATFLHYRTWQMLDFYSAFMMITRTTMMVVYNTSDSEDDPVHFKRNMSIKQVVTVCLDMIGLLMILENIDTKIMVGVLSGLCFIMITIAVIFFRDVLRHIDLTDLVCGSLVIAIASIFFFVVPEGHYWLVHSLWHIFVALGVALMVEALNKQWSLVLWFYHSTCGRCRCSRTWCTRANSQLVRSCP